MRELPEQYHKTLRDLLGEPEKGFRPFQSDTIGAILDGRDVLTIVPTGGGKSLCYQVPALHLPGLTLVISPLLALMEDQVKKLLHTEVYRGKVAALCSSFIVDRNGFHATNDSENPESSRTLREQIFVDAIRGQYKLMYVTPERLRRGNFTLFVQKCPISMIAVDEAHCVSLFGYEFRYPYLEIGRLPGMIGYHPIIAAFTATATKSIQADILHLLGMENPKFVSDDDPKDGLPRKNLSFSVHQFRCPEETAAFRQAQKEEQAKAAALSAAKKANSAVEDAAKALEQAKAAVKKAEFAEKKAVLLKKEKALLRYLREHPEEKGFVYCSTTATVDAVHAYLTRHRIAATRYYAQLDSKEKEGTKQANYEAFECGKVRVIVSTNALGMGIDLPDIRFVIHMDMPLCLENYYQEAGRAGRDGASASCMLYHWPGDINICHYLIGISLKENALSRQDRKKRRQIAQTRLEHMRLYAANAEDLAGEALHRRILDYFRTFDPYALPDAKQKSATDLDVYSELKRPSVLYVNRTYIAGMLRKGNMAESDLMISSKGARGKKPREHNRTLRPRQYVSYAVTQQGGPPEEPLSYFDLMVADAVYTLMKHRIQPIYARQIICLLSGRAEQALTKDRKEAVEASIEKMMRTEIVIDRSKSATMGFAYGDDNMAGMNLRGSFLPLRRLERNGFEYDPGDLPPLYLYAELTNGQFYSFPVKTLEAALGKKTGESSKNLLPASTVNLQILHYLLRRIDSMQKRPSATYYAYTRPTILCKSIIKELNISLPDDKPSNTKRKMNTIFTLAEKMLSNLKAAGVIADYTPNPSELKFEIQRFHRAD